MAILCDTGFGTKISDKERKQIAAADSRSLTDSLNEVGVAPAQITHVIFSHLHFDHAGGATCGLLDPQADKTDLQVTFPNAVHVVQKQELDDALGNLPELAGSYYEPELRFLSDSAKWRLSEGEDKVLEGIRVVPTGGHTAGHQTVWIESQGESGVYLGDLCPTSAHLNVFWTMAYDAFQLDVRRKKFELLSKIAREKSILFFDHDPEIKAATIRVKNDKSFEIDRVISLA